MVGIGTYNDGLTFKPGVRFGTASFACNGASNPVISGPTSTLIGSLAGRIQSITYAATGTFTITMVPGFTFPFTPIIEPSNSSADGTLTNAFFCFVTGAWSNTTRSFVIQCQQTIGTNFQVPANANNRVNFSFEGLDNTGK